MGHARHSRDAAGSRDRGTVDLVSMVGDDDVQLYLLAMKTLYRRLRRGWGTEQRASNFVTANSPRPVVLPFPAYSCFFPGGPRAEAKYLHFIGSHRFDEDFYGRHALAAIADLASAGVPERVARTPTQAAG